MQIVCKKCGSSELYLKKKGPQVGVYCNKCGAWIKWVGKKDLPAFTRKGFKIHEETYDPLINFAPVDNSSIENEPVPTNYGVVGTGYQGFQSQAHTSQQDEYDNEDMPFDYGSEADYPTGGFEENTDFDEITEDNKMEFCPVCSTGDIPLLDEVTGSVVLRIADNVLVISDKVSGDMLGMAKVERCPNCGKKLG